MLALSLLVTSQSHIFISFFKIFFMICIFGLFHGLILLPVVLCLLGPIENEDEKSQEARKNAVALANAKESLDHQFQPPVDQPGHNHYQQPISQPSNNHYEQPINQPSNNSHYQQTTDQP